MTRPLTGTLVLAVACVVAIGGAGADAVSDALATPVTASWKGLPVRTAAERLTEIARVAVVIDRRIDPASLVTLDVAGESVGEVLTLVAAAAGAQTTAYAGHLRVVPGGKVAGLATAEAARQAELAALPRQVRTAVAASATSSWPDGAVPREILTELAAAAGLALDGLDEVPHDHFPAARLPALSRADRIDLVLAHFDRRVEWRPQAGQARSSSAFMIVPIAAPLTAAPQPALPPRSPPRPASKPSAPATYSLTVAAPLDELLATLARKMSLTLALDRPALARVGVAPGEIVRLELKDVSRERLLDAILGPRGLRWRIEGETLSVSDAFR